MTGGESSLRSLLAQVPWSQLAHAYDYATDAEEQLALLFDNDDPTTTAAVAGWIESSLLHQGSIYSATIPALHLLVELASLRPEHSINDRIGELLDIIADALEWLAEDPHEPSPVETGTAPIFEAFVGPAAATDDDFDTYELAGTVRRSTLERLGLASIPLLVRMRTTGTDEDRAIALATLKRIADEVPESIDAEALELTRSAVDGLND